MLGHLQSSKDNYGQKMEIDMLTGKRCQCVVCGEVFSTEKNFDKHRKGDYDNRYFVDPAEVGLQVRETDKGNYWVVPAPEGMSWR